jgi:alpha-beta hydrolase superfamily lysophospholipase
MPWTEDQLLQRGLRLRGMHVDPKGPPRALVLIVHGMGEHAGRYEHVADALAARGYAVYGFDLRGHGRSEGLRGHVDGFQQYSADIACAQAAAQGRLPIGTPLFIYGHSMGGLAVLNYVLDVPDHGAAGLLLSNPCLKVAVQAPAWKVVLGKGLSRVLPKLRLGNEVDATLISRVPDEVAKYTNDPLVHGLISTRLYTSLLRAMDRVNGAPGRVSAPSFWMVGASDRIVAPDGARSFVAKVPAGTAELREWPGSYHEPHNDLDRDEVIAAMLDWLDRRTARAAA